MAQYIRSSGVRANMAAAATYYTHLYSGCTTTQTVVLRSELYARAAGVTYNLRVQVRSNTIDSGSTVIVAQKNGVDANLTITIPFGATGSFADSTHTDVIAVGDKYIIKFTNTGTTGVIATSLTAAFNTESNTNEIATVGSLSTAAVSTTAYYTISGNNTGTGVEADAQVKITTACTARKFQAFVYTNAKTGTSIFRTRKNGADGNQIISVLAAATGLFEDTSNSDTLMDGDLYNITFTTGTGTGSIGFSEAGVCLDYAGSTYDLHCVPTNTGVARGAGATQVGYTPFGCTPSNATYPGNAMTIPTPITVSRMRLYLNANTYTGPATAQLFKNNVAGNNTFTIGAGVTGWFEDSTNTDTVPAGTLLTFNIVGGTSGSITIMGWGSKITSTYTPATISNVSSIANLAMLTL